MLTLSRSRMRWALLATGLLLVLGLRLAPSLPLQFIIPFSLAWLALLGFLLLSAHTVLRAWIGPKGAAALLLAGGAAPVVATALRPGPELAARLPCPRNWLSPASWLLRSSPTGRATLQVDDVPVVICYGRPASRGRTMLGGARVPYGRLWRTGANEPTTIISPIAITVAGIAMEPGRAALYTIPGPESWEIILNASTSQWGVEPEYTEAVMAHELGRAVVPSEPAPSFVERLHIRPDPSGFVLEWETTRVRLAVARGHR